MLRESLLLQAWESGQGQSPTEQALCLLRYGYPERPLAQLLSLSVGERDALLFALREQSVGPNLQGAARCPQCQQQSQFSVPLAALRVPNPGVGTQTFVLQHQALQISYRLPRVADLRQAARLADVDAVRAFLIRSCIVAVSCGGDEVTRSAWDALPASVEQALAAAMTANDPQSEVLLSLCCAHCGHGWSALLDIVRFVWTELSAQAERLIAEVDVLARAYGWTESEILQLGPARRRRYLQLVSHE
jgi:hypothetical protein